MVYIINNFNSNKTNMCWWRHCNILFKSVLLLDNSLITGNMRMFSQYTKRGIIKLYQYLFYLFVSLTTSIYFLDSNKLTSKKQSGFRLGIQQYTNWFLLGLPFISLSRVWWDTSAIFLDISKASDKVFARGRYI